VGGWDEHPILARGREDTEWWIRVVRHGFRIRVIDEPLYLYREAQTADDAARSLDMNARRDEVELRKYIIKKHGDLHAKYPSQRRRLLAMACQAEARFHQSSGNHWRSIFRMWQAAMYSPQKRTVIKAMKTTLAGLLGERKLESILRWKRRMAGA
jgi:GT2 family glycosyltransferase